MANETPGEINERQKMFCREYIIDFNGARAARAAGYAEDSAAVEASRLLINDNIQAFLSKLIEKRANKLEITAEKVLNEFARMAFMDPRKFYDEAGNLKPITELDDDTAACVAGLEIIEMKDGDGRTYGNLKKVKFTDKARSLESLSKHLGIYAKDNDQKKVEATLFYLPKENASPEDPNAKVSTPDAGK